ncbi:hypothetical protein D9615_004797 [Tricholomella constricta]|uniref:DUF6534 domain-containing protein n=1 Tax=Tricholomella constricta TaxID=117010 RepID=A0A8H5HGC9_9AGAR|nr:hypothetical protein D9615_004797 [Tricholomella constricta]
MPSIPLLFGPMLIGVFFNMILYGVLIVQVYNYYQMYKKDVSWIRYLVLYLFIVESANTAFDMFIVYEPLILRYGDPDGTKYFPTLFATEPIVIVAVSFPIQLFFAWRINVLTKSIWIPSIIVLLATVSLAGGIWTGVMIAILRLFAKKPELHNPALVWFLSGCVADVLITATLVYTLSKRRTGFVATDDTISKIMRMTVQTGMLTAFFAVGDVIFFMTLPRTALNFLWDLALSKLYSNCLLSTLNARASLNRKVTGSSDRPRISTANNQQRQLDAFESSHARRDIFLPSGMAGVQPLYGPMLIGVFFNMILYGVLIVQMFSYYQTYGSKDAIRTKSLVLYLFLVETINTGLNMVMMYEPLIIRHGTEDATKFFPLMLTSEPIMIVAISTPIQIFFARRIWKFSGSLWIPGAICMLAMCSLAGGIWTAVKTKNLRLFVMKPRLHTPALVWFVTAAAADILITFSLALILYKRKTGHSTTDALIGRIIAFTLQTGFLTALLAISDVIFFLALPRVTINFIWDLILTKIYANSLLSTLNARAEWNNQLEAQRNDLIFHDVQQSVGPRPVVSGNSFPHDIAPTNYESSFYVLEVP